jgi:hypothetical protein
MEAREEQDARRKTKQEGAAAEEQQLARDSSGKCGGL